MLSGKDAAAIAASLAGRPIRADDVAALRRVFYADGVIDRAEAEAICRLEAAAPARCAQWAAFYVEALTEYILFREPPQGYVSPDNAAWLIAQLSADGRVRTETELELVVRVMEKATGVPESLSAFALRQVAGAVIDGDGPLARGGRLMPGVIGRDEVELLRRILYAFGHEGTVGISHEEAEVLFDLNDRTCEADNDPAWSDLFVKAIANFLMAAHGGYRLPTRAEALRREAWLDGSEPGVAGVFGDMMASMLAGGLRGVWSAWSGEADAAAERSRVREAEARADEAVTSTEVRWLAERIGRDGVIHENERALLKFLSEQSPDIHPSLRTLLDTAA